MYNVDLLISEDIKENLTYYDFINDYEKEIINIFEIINNHKELDKFFINEVFFLKKFNLFPNEYIECEREYISIIISISILRSFIDFTSYEYYLKNDIESENNSDLLMFESDKLINQTLIFIKHFIIWIEINFNANEIIKTIFKEDLNKLRKGVYKIFLILNDNKVLNKNVIWFKNKSLCFFTLTLNLKTIINPNVFNKNFKIYKRNKFEIYLYINHFSNMFNFLKENMYSGAVAKIDIDSKFIKNLLDSKAMIDFELLEDFFNMKLLNYGYSRERLLIEYESTLKLIKLSIERADKFSHKEFSKKLTEIMELIRLDSLIKNKKENQFYYFPSNICFRGRTYFISAISFTFYKEFRYCLYLGYYDNNFKEPFHPLNIKIKGILSQYLNKVDLITKYNFKNKTNSIKESILWLIISVAELKKNELGEFSHIYEILELGIKLINDDNSIKSFTKLDDIFKFKSIMKILNEIENNIFIKRLVSKDATASCFQHLVKVLGSAESDSLKWCNLKSDDTWYDTYKIILKLWKNTLKDTTKNIMIDKYFTRNTIKRPTMTIQYGAKFNTCWKYFLEECSDLKDDEREILFNIFKNFFNFINNNIGLLDINPKEILRELKNLGFNITMKDLVEINLKYYKTKTKQIKVVHDGKRHTKQKQIITNSLDVIKLKSASRANYIHAHDAAIVRYIISIQSILTIHDCFLIDYMSITFLIAIINEAMRKTFHDLGLNKKTQTNDIFSIFIVI